MKTVWILHHIWDWKFDEIVGVYRTEEAAQKAQAEKISRKKMSDYQRYTITEHSIED